jgi:hypothetical protein
MSFQSESPLYRDVCIEVASTIIHDLRRNPTAWNEFDPNRFDDICLRMETDDD